MCAPVTSPVISELSYSYTKRPLLHVVHHSVPSPIACSIRIVYTVCHTVRGWEGLQVCVTVCACVGLYSRMSEDSFGTRHKENFM